MRSRVLLTGATGLLGTWLRRTAPTDVEVIALTHRTPLTEDGPQVAADLCDRTAAVEAVTRAAPAVVLHAAYATDQRSIVDATRHTAEGAAAAGADLVFISTDAVFSGDGEVRTEGDEPDPVWDYGRWKTEAEALAGAAATTAAVVRLPLLVSLDPDDHVTARIRRTLVDGEPASWFHDELRQPAYASEVATAIWRLAALDPAARAGSWHLPGPEVLSRFEIAVRTARALGLPPAALRPQGTPTEAQRPRALILGDDRARRDLGWAPSPVFERDLGGT